MALLNDDPPLNSEEEEQLAADALGEPVAVYRAGGRRAKIKTIVGISLILVGLLINYLWWFRGPAKFGHWEFHLLFWPLAIGIGLLWFLYRNRGLRVMLFPTGILRLQAGQTTSIPWENIRSIRMRSDHTEPDYEWDENRQLTGCRMTAVVPVLQVWNTWLEVDLVEGDAVRFTPAVEDFPDLAKRIQQIVFQERWAQQFEELANGKSLEFAEMFVSNRGLTQIGRFLAWNEIQEVKMLNRIITIKKRDSWGTWWAKDTSLLPNLPLFLGLLAVLGDHTVRTQELAPAEAKPTPTDEAA
jgi:hypothetical protein